MELQSYCTCKISKLLEKFLKIEKNSLNLMRVSEQKYPFYILIYDFLKRRTNSKVAKTVVFSKNHINKNTRDNTALIPSLDSVYFSLFLGIFQAILKFHMYMYMYM